MEKIIDKQHLTDWLTQLEGYELYGPTTGNSEQDSRWCFLPLEDTRQLDLQYLNTARSPKCAVFPQYDVLLSYKETIHPDNEDDTLLEVKEQIPRIGNRVFIGVRPCDARAITLLDHVFGGDFRDPYYWQRRDKTILVGLGCTVPPGPNCFCTSVGGSPHGTEGLDILITELGDAYFVETHSQKGVGLMDIPNPKCFRVPTNEERKSLRSIKERATRKISKKIKHLEQTVTRLESMQLFQSDYWEQESMACIRCGICTYLCPSCHCFDISDEVENVAPLEGKRVRNWDNCQFPDFTMHSSGHNPRPGKASRLRRRVLHKFRYFRENHGQHLCTGCGRCISQCPVGIDIVEILNGIESYAITLQQKAARDRERQHTVARGVGP